MDNSELIQQARALCEGATPGPWRYKETADYSEIYDNHSWGKALSPLAMVGSNLDDAAFIAASRTLVPQLCDALEAAEKELIEYHHTQKVVDGKTAENARLRKINELLTARAEKAEAENQRYRSAKITPATGMTAMSAEITMPDANHARTTKKPLPLPPKGE